jgi:hypothetical protein
VSHPPFAERVQGDFLIFCFHFLDFIPFLQENDRFGVKSSNKTPTNNWADFRRFRDEYGTLYEKTPQLN